MISNTVPSAWLLISNSEVVDHLAILGKMLRDEGVRVTYIAPDTPGGLPWDRAVAESTIRHYDPLADGVTLCNRNSDLSVDPQSIAIPQTPYLDDHFPKWFFEKFSNARLVYAPYGFTVRGDEMFSSIVDIRFSRWVMHNLESIWQRELEKQVISSQKYVRVGHPTLWWLRDRMRENTETDVGDGNTIRVAVQFHWMEQYCSFPYTISFLSDLAKWLWSEFASRLRVNAHPFLGLFDNYQPPLGYRGANLSEGKSEFRDLVTSGAVVLSDQPFVSSFAITDVWIADGQSTIAFGAAVGATVSVPIMPNTHDLVPEIAALPNVHRHDPLDAAASLESIRQLIEQVSTDRSRPTYFHALGLVEGRNPIQELLSRM